MNAQSKRPLITVLVIFLGLGVLGAVSSYAGRVMNTVQPGQTRFVTEDEFEQIGTYQMVKIGDGDWHRSYSENATPEECGTEPTVESMPYGTEFRMLIVPNREVAPREKLQKTFTKDGQAVAAQTKNLEGADITGGKRSTCFVDASSITQTGAMGGAYDVAPEGPLPVGRYRFELVSGTEVLSAGDLTITAT